MTNIEQITEKKETNSDDDGSKNLPVSEERLDKKKFVRDIFFVLVGNAFALLSGVLIGFVIPRIMGGENYGYYKTFSLYAGYIGLFHFGFCDGIFLLYAGLALSQIDKRKFRALFKLYFFIEFFFSAALFAAAFAAFGTDFFWILAFLGANLLLTNVMTYFQYLSQVVGRFKELSFVHIAQSLLKIIIVMVFYVLWKNGNIQILNYYWFLLALTSITFAVVIFYFIKYHDLVFGEGLRLRAIKGEFLQIIRVGIPLLAANLACGLFLTIDRQFVSVLVGMDVYSIRDFGTYSFAYNMLSLITTLISAVSVVIYPTLRKIPESQLGRTYLRSLKIVCLVTTFCMLSYQPLSFVVEKWLKDYLDSLPILEIILPTAVFTSCTTIVSFNFFKVIKKTNVFFAITVLSLLCAVGADFIAFYFWRSLNSISAASVVVTALWFLACDIYLRIKFGIKGFKTPLFSILLITCYFLVNSLLQNLIYNFFVSLAVFTFLVLCFYGKEIISSLKRRRP